MKLLNSNSTSLPAQVGSPQLCLLLLPPLQDLLPACHTGDDTATWLRDSMLTLRLQDTAAADVAVSGALVGVARHCACSGVLCAAPFLLPVHRISSTSCLLHTAGFSWQPRSVRPTLWTEPSQARSALEPLLPECLAGSDADGDGEHAGAALGFREVYLAEDRVRRAPPGCRQGGWQVNRSSAWHGTDALAGCWQEQHSCSTQSLDPAPSQTLPLMQPALHRMPPTVWRLHGGPWRRGRARGSLCGARLAACRSRRVRHGGCKATGMLHLLVMQAFLARRCTCIAQPGCSPPHLPCLTWPRDAVCSARWRCLGLVRQPCGGGGSRGGSHRRLAGGAGKGRPLFAQNGGSRHGAGPVWRLGGGGWAGGGG